MFINGINNGIHFFRYNELYDRRNIRIIGDIEINLYQLKN